MAAKKQLTIEITITASLDTDVDVAEAERQIHGYMSDVVETMRTVWGGEWTKSEPVAMPA